MKRRILVVGAGAREHAIVRAIKRSRHLTDVLCWSSTYNPGIYRVAANYGVGDDCHPESLASFCAQHGKIDFAIVGAEAPLANGVADMLWARAIPTLGPTKVLAQLESSKGFARQLLEKYRIYANPDYRIFNSMQGVREFLELWPRAYVIKADGLMGGKGVKVFGDHLTSDDQAIAFCESLVKRKLSFVIEQKLEGQEFSLISFVDGERLIHCPPVQDHKRAFFDDKGPNTGGMGSYSDANHSLPFLSPRDIEQARMINTQTLAALGREYRQKYYGFLYGGFIATAYGVKLIEYNVRLGDPEAVNLLALLETDFVDLCEAMLTGSMTEQSVRFARQATVCKYVVPEGYPDRPAAGKPIDFSRVRQQDQRLYFGALNEIAGQLVTTTSRAAAILGVGDTIEIAEAIAESEVQRVSGIVFHRSDIGTSDLINKRVEHMRSLRVFPRKRILW